MQRKFFNSNTFQYAIADPRYAVSRHSDVYSGTAITVSAVSALVSRYSGDYSGLYSDATKVAATVVPL